MSSSVRLNSLYTAAPVCSPSRAALLTGLYPVSTGVYPGVFFPGDLGGLSPEHRTVAGELKSRNYSTYHIGKLPVKYKQLFYEVFLKWHLGVGLSGEYLPQNHGFDHYLGIPYSHDMCPCTECFPGQPCHDSCRPDTVSCPLFRDQTIIQQPADLTTLTNTYTQEAVKFIKSSARSGMKYLLYLAYHHPHHPQFAGRQFYNQSNRKSFGDSLLELDWSVGKIMETLENLQLREKTVVIFTSDNGPSIARHERGGCAGLLRCGKGTTFEGGMRVPGLVNFPRVLKPGVFNGIFSQMDFLPLILDYVDGPVPSPLTSPRDCLLFYPDSPVKELGPYAIRCGAYKAHVYSQGSSLSDTENPDRMCSDPRITHHSPPLLYHLDSDPGERWDLSSALPGLASSLSARLEEMAGRVSWAPSEMARGHSDLAAPCCNKLPCKPWPSCCDCKFEENKDRT